MLQERHFIKRLAKRLINCENRNINKILFVCILLLIRLGRVLNLLLFQILTMGFKNFILILSLLILARMSQVSKFERVLSPINVTSNLLEFNFSISGPGPGAEQAGQWLDVQFSWLAQGLSAHGARHELGGGRGLLSNDLWTPSHRWEYSISSNLHFVYVQMIRQNIYENIWNWGASPELSGLDFINPSLRLSSLGRKLRMFGSVFFISDFCFRNDFDWSEVSLAPGDGWGEYVEEYESSLCVSLDIDHGFRWDTRWVGNCNVVIADIVRFIWDFPPFQILPGSNGYRISLSNWA